MEYDEGTREEVKRETRGGKPQVFFSLSYLFIGSFIITILAIFQPMQDKFYLGIR